MGHQHAPILSIHKHRGLGESYGGGGEGARAEGEARVYEIKPSKVIRVEGECRPPPKTARETLGVYQENK